MANLISAAIASLDGYVADTKGRFDWSEPDEELHTLVNDLERSVGTYLYGRRMYEVMKAWETDDLVADQPEHVRAYADVWRDTDKIVYSSSLDEVDTARTRLERRFDPDAVREMKATAERDIAIGGPTLAAEAFRAGLVDELHLFLSPIVVGGGTPALPDDVVIQLELADERRLGNGVVYLRYSVSKSPIRLPSLSLK